MSSLDRKIGGISDVLIDIEELLQHSSLSFQEIAKELNVPLDWVHNTVISMNKIEWEKHNVKS